MSISIIHTCFSKRSQALSATSLPTYFKRELSAAVAMPYDQNNPTADNTTTDHSYSNSNSSASSQNVRRPLNLRLSLQHLLICFLNRPRKARATHHPLPTGPTNGKPSHEPGLTEAPGSGRGPRNQPVTGSARATRTTRWQHGWRRASRRWPGTVLDISEARAGTGGRRSGATARRRIRSHRLRKTGVKGAGHASIETASFGWWLKRG